MATPELDTIRPGVAFNPLAGASFRRFERDRGRTDVNSSYREWDLQERWHKESVDFLAGRIPYPGHAYAVDPRYSEHCLGNAYDTDDWNAPGYLAKAAEYGWIQTDKSRGEEHHLAYRADRDKHRNDLTPAGSHITPTESEMPLTDADVSKILNFPAFTGGPSVSTMLKEVHAVHEAIFAGGPSMPDNGRSIGASLAGLVTVADREFAPVERGAERIPVRQDNADTNTMVRRLVAKLLPPTGK
jgi:hypothetical protein